MLTMKVFVCYFMLVFSLGHLSAQANSRAMDLIAILGKAGSIRVEKIGLLLDGGSTSLTLVGGNGARLTIRLSASKLKVSEYSLSFIIDKKVLFLEEKEAEASWTVIRVGLEKEALIKVLSPNSSSLLEISKNPKIDRKKIHWDY